jgi:hypothetical protein
MFHVCSFPAGSEAVNLRMACLQLPSFKLNSRGWPSKNRTPSSGGDLPNIRTLTMQMGSLHPIRTIDGEFRSRIQPFKRLCSASTYHIHL